MKCSRRTFLQAGSFSALGLALATADSSVAKVAYRRRLDKVVGKIPTICGQCKASCPMVAIKRQSGHIRLTGNPASPIHGNTLCARGMAAVELLADPDRLKYPLKRVGPRGAGQWKRITWQQAMAEIGEQLAKALKNHGSQSLALLCGSSSSAYIRDLYEALACPNIYHSSQMHSAAIRDLGYGTVFGQVPDPRYLPELDRAECLVLMGSHVGENNLVSQQKQVCDFRNRGGKLVVVDPRFSTMAAKADQYLAIRPGTDTALLLGWIHHVLANSLYDPFLVQDVVGLEELQEAASPYTLDYTAEITDLPADMIRQAVEAMVQAGARTVIMPGSHLSWYGADVNRVRAQAILTALLGCWPSRPMPAFDFEAHQKPLSFSRLMHHVGNKDIKVTAIWGQNPLQAEMAPYKTMAALKKAEFIFACDVLPSEPTLYADIILPEAAFLERMDGPYSWQMGSQIMTGCRFPVVTAPSECRGPYEIVRELATACGQQELFAAAHVNDHLDAALVSLGSSLEQLKDAGGLLLRSNGAGDTASAEGKPFAAPMARVFDEPVFSSQATSFPTPSGKIEFYSNWLAHNGFSPLPLYEPPLSRPDGYLRLLYGRCPAHSLTRTAGFSWLNHEIPENELWLAEAVAAKLGINDGEEVRLESVAGFRSLNKVTVKVSPGIREDCCYMSHGFGNRSPFIREAYLRGTSDSAMMSRGRVDVVSGTRGMRDTFVRLLRSSSGA